MSEKTDHVKDGDNVTPSADTPQASELSEAELDAVAGGIAGSAILSSRALGSGLATPGSGIAMPGTGLAMPGTESLVPGGGLTAGTGIAIGPGLAFSPDSEK